MAWAIWITGLPGSGKTWYAEAAMQFFKSKGVVVQHLQMDAFRKFLTPEMKYNEKERELAYRAMVLAGKLLVENDINVLFDATAHRRRWRDLARDEINNFAEVYVKCSIETCMKREAGRQDHPTAKDIYKKALVDMKAGRKVKLAGEVPGITVPYEEPNRAELVIDGEAESKEGAARKIYELAETL
jgi:adenylylsulfate kinase